MSSGRPRADTDQSSRLTTLQQNPGLGDLQSGRGELQVSGELRSLQDEWEHLLNREDLSLEPIPPSLIYSNNIQEENNDTREESKDKRKTSDVEKYAACALWMDDGVMGFSIDYPYDAFELKCYWLRQSKLFTKFFFACCFVHIILPFFEEPVCPWVERGELSMLSHDGRVSPFLLNFIGLFCILVYFLDLYLWLRVNNRGRSMLNLSFYKNGWVLTRFILCVILLIDTILFFFTGRAIRFARGVIPFVFISRRVSMRQLLQGLLNAVSKTVNVLILFTAMVFIFGYTGFLVFHNVDTEKENRFETLPGAVLTVLHVLAGRSYNAFVGNQYFDVHWASGFFFVSLMIAGDFLCTNLIIAVGNRQFKLFSNLIYKRQLRNRRQALVTIHEVLSDENGYISKTDWLRFCARIRGMIRVSPEMAHVLFGLEAESDPSSPHCNTIDCVGLFRLAALIAARVDVIDADLLKQEAEASESGQNSHRGAADPSSSDHRRSSLLQQKEESFLTMDVFGVDDIMTSSLFGFPDDGDQLDDEFTGRDRATTIEMSRQGRPSAGKASDGALLSCEGRASPRTALARALESLQGLCSGIISFRRVSVRSFLPFLLANSGDDIVLSPFAVFFSLFRVLLAVQLVQISGEQGSPSWLRVGWVVQAFLMLESLILLSGLGVSGFVQRSGSLYSLVLNVLSLGFMIAVGPRADQQGHPVFVLLLVTQIFRFFRSFRFLRDYDFMMSLLPLIVRMLLLFASVVYFFAVIGYTRFCHTFPTDIGAQQVDDDGASWEEFSGLLNFSTLLKTIFTLYEVSILGNWSIVMGAASRKEPVLAFLFFLPYRLLMAMLVIPLLFSFVMQAFISHRDKLARKELVVDRMETYSKLDRYFYNDPSSLPCAEDPQLTKRSVDEAVQEIMRKKELAKASWEAERQLQSPRKSKRRASVISKNLSQSFTDIAEGNFFGPDISIPGRKASQEGTMSSKKAIHSGEKGQSMMSFWSGGEQGPSNLQRHQRNADILGSMLEEALYQLGKTLEEKADAEATLSSLKERRKGFGLGKEDTQ